MLRDRTWAGINKGGDSGLAKARNLPGKILLAGALAFPGAALAGPFSPVVELPKGGPIQQEVADMAFGGKARYFAMGSTFGDVRIWETSDWSLASKIDFFRHHSREKQKTTPDLQGHTIEEFQEKYGFNPNRSPVSALAFLEADPPAKGSAGKASARAKGAAQPPTRLAVSYAPYPAQVVKAPEGQLLHSLGHKTNDGPSFGPIKFGTARGGGMLAGPSSGGPAIDVWNTRSGKHVSRIPDPSGDFPSVLVKEARLSPRGKYFAVGFDDGTIQIFDPKKEELVSTLKPQSSGKSEEASVSGLYMKRKGNNLIIFSASRNGTIQKRLALQGSVIRKKTFDQPINAFVPYRTNRPSRSKGGESQALFSKGGELFRIDWGTMETKSLFSSQYREIDHIATGAGGDFVAIAGKKEGAPSKSSVTILEPRD